MSQNDITDDLGAALGLAEALDDGQIRAMIKKVLEEWKNISSQCQGNLKGVIKLGKKRKPGFLKIDGFSNPEKALEQCPQKLEKPLFREFRFPPLSKTIIDLWWEAHRQLYDAVLRFLKNDDGRPAILIQARKNCPRGCPKTNEWTNVRKDFISSQDVEFPLDHVDLMLCCVAHIHFSSQLEEVDSLPLEDWTNSLKRLPYDDPLWGNRFDFFCQQIKEIRKSKHAAQSVVASLKNALAEVEQKFADDLTFLELKIPSVTRETISPDFDSVRKLTDNLKKTLERFSGRRRELKEAKTYTLQKTFEKKQQEAAERVDKVHSELKEMLDQQPLPTTKNPSARSASLQPERENRQMEAKEKEIKQLRQQVEKLQKTAADNKEEIKKLRTNLDTSRKDEKLWREAYNDVKRRKTAADADGQKTDKKVRSVQEAFEIAEHDYPDKLLVKLNNHSKWKEKANNFEKPDEVLKALEWLAVIYRDARMNGASNPNLDESLRQTCSNWFYSANQSEFALREFPGWYKTIVNNKTYDLEPHIGTGKSRDERHTIRIAFAWDAELKKVVVGFVGQHQHTPKKA